MASRPRPIFNSVEWSSHYYKIPYKYLDTRTLRNIRVSANYLLWIIWHIHNDQPIRQFWIDGVKKYLYHTSFLRWVVEKTGSELKERKKKVSFAYGYRKETMSRSLLEHIPPKTDEIAADVVWLLEYWRVKRNREFGRVKLPRVYVELAQRYYGYSPHSASLEGVDLDSGISLDVDREWYFVQSQEAAKIDHNLVVAYLRGASTER